MDFTGINIGSFEHRLLLAFTLGFIIGFERQWRHKLAGVKTNALVAGGSALFILLSEKMTGDPSGASRVAANIITGVGFLGAGVMMRNGPRNIIGINTAATIWCSAAIGSLAGMGYWYESLAGTVFVVVGNIILRPIGARIDRRISQINESGYSYALYIECRNGATNLVKEPLIQLVQESKTLHISSLSTEGMHRVVAEILSLDKRQSDIETIVNALSKLPDTLSVKWEENKDMRE